MGRLEGKVAIITGAGIGIGEETAMLFAREGAKLGLLDVNEGELKRVVGEINKLGGEAYMVVGDVRKTEDIDKWVKTAISKYGKIDILFNNAGVFVTDTVPGSDKFYDATEEAWNRTMDINLKGAWLCCRAVIPHLLKQGKGKIVNLASGDGLIGIAQPIAYMCSKFGMVGMTRSLAVELAAKGINVNAICPGEVDTAMTRAAIEEFGPLENLEPAWGIKSLIPPPIPIDGVSNLALFLASDDSDYLHGRSIHIGAWAALIP